MAYSDLQLNQTVSFNNLQSGVTQGYFVAKTTIPVSAKQITKTEANTYVNINTALPGYAAKASNQLVTRENLQGATNVFPYTIYALADIGGVGGYYAWKSIDGGNNFNQLSGLSSSANWTEIAGDVAGNYIAVIDKTINNQIYISSNSGATFSAVSLNSANFYPYGVSMSTNGQYIAVSGFSYIPDNSATGYTKLAVSSNYGASFTTTYVDSTLRPYWYSPVQPDSGKVSISGNGQYITAVFSYGEYVGFPFDYKRPVGFKITSSNYGASWTVSGTTTYALFLGIALSNTGQYQFLTSDWYDRNNVFPANWVEGFKGYISTDYGASWTQKFEEYNYNNTSGYIPSGLRFAGVSSSGSSMVAANSGYTYNTEIKRRYASPDYGTNFYSYDGVANSQGLSVGLTPVSGITNSYVALFTNNSTFYYSTDGGLNAWYPKEIANRFFKHVYNKALNTPALSYSYTLYYNTTTVLPTVTGFNTAVDACDLSTNSFVVYSNSSTVGIGMKLYYDIYGITPIVANPSTGSNTYYRINGNSVQFGSDGYTINSVAACASYITYYADEYECDGIDCTYVQSNVLVVLPDSFTPDYTKYYLLQAGGPRIFFLDTTTTGVGLILSTTNYNSCLEICGV
tara:strand:- start:142 stop:2019 length:1878 start_codon:yes stop_codon:yes gene_type:complete